MNFDEQSAEPRAPITDPRLLQAEADRAVAREAVRRAYDEIGALAEATTKSREMSLRWTDEKHQTQQQSFRECRDNPAADWQGLSELLAKLSQKINYADTFLQWSVEHEGPRLRLALQRAEADVAFQEMKVAGLLADIADLEFRTSMGAITAEYGPTVAVSAKVTALQDIAQAAAKKYSSALTAIEEETRRQQQQAQARASFGLVTRR